MIKFNLSESDIIELEEKYKAFRNSKIALADIPLSFLLLCTIANQKKLSEQIEEIRTSIQNLKK